MSSHAQVHPFDVGDALLLGHSTTGNSQLVWVEEIALVNCVVRRWDGARIWWPNVLLDAYPLINLSRSNNKWESVEVSGVCLVIQSCSCACCLLAQRLDMERLVALYAAGRLTL